MDFETDAYPKILLLEGNRYENVKNDPGGATNKGVIQVTYSGYLKERALPDADVKDITDVEAQLIYRDNYWNKLKCSLMPDKVDFAVFQSGVNQGNRVAAIMLQECLTAVPDGHIGNDTLERFALYSSNEIIKNFLKKQLERYEKIIGRNPVLDKFRVGWQARVNRTAEWCGVTI